MCSRGRVGVARGSSGLQPMRATIPFQLSPKAQVAVRDAKSVSGSEKQLWCSLHGQILHNQSLDDLVGPYLHGHWPKDGVHHKDKATQTPASWADDPPRDTSTLVGGTHKRSASWSSAAHREVSRQRQPQAAVVLGGSLDRRRTHALTQAGPSAWLTQSQPLPIPLGSVHTRLRHSEEKLDEELETIFKQESLLQLSDFLVPNGRRGPVPPYSNSSSSRSSSIERQSDLFSSSPSSPATLLLSSSTPSPCPPPPSSPGGGAPLPNGEVCVEDGLSIPLLSRSAVGVEDGPLNLLASSPRPNKSVCFQREPPEGCEKVPVCEETLFSRLYHVVPSRPDPGKVNFTPREGSTFCPVHLLKPLSPSMDFLFRNLSVSSASERAGPGVTTAPQS